MDHFRSGISQNAPIKGLFTEKNNLNMSYANKGAILIAVIS